MTEIETIIVRLKRKQGLFLGKVVITEFTGETTKHDIDEEAIRNVIAALQMNIGKVNSYDLY